MGVDDLEHIVTNDGAQFGQRNVLDYGVATEEGGDEAAAAQQRHGIRGNGAEGLTECLLSHSETQLKELSDIVGMYVMDGGKAQIRQLHGPARGQSLIDIHAIAAALRVEGQPAATADVPRMNDCVREAIPAPGAV